VPDEHPSCIRVAGQQPPIPVGTAVNLSRPNGHGGICSLFRPHHIVATGAVRHPRSRGRRFKLRYYRNLLLLPARPSGSNADALPSVTPITLSPRPAEPANQPGLDWIAADPEHNRDGRGRRPRREPRRLAPAPTIAVSPALIEWGGVRLRIYQQQDPALLFRFLT